MTRRDEIGKRTFVDVGSERLTVLCEAVGFDPERVDAMTRLFRRLVAPWGERLCGTPSGFRSDIGEDGTPFEFSLALSDGAPEVRMMVEAQGEGGTLAANRDAARALLSSLEGELGLSVARFRQIEDLFLSGNPEGCFSLWHAAVCRPGHPLMMKIYLNPKAHGDAQATRLVRDALARLGLGHAWPSVVEAMARGPGLDELKYVGLDLTTRPGARVKVYIYHRHATARDLEAAAAIGRAYVPGAVTTFCRTLTGTEGPFPGAPIATCLMFDDDGARPAVTGVYVPFRGHVATDFEARDRIRAFLDAHGGDTANFDRVLAAFPDRSLAEPAGMISYASLRNGGGTPRVTVYLNPELYRVDEPGQG